MFGEESWRDILVMALCYAYVGGVILAASRIRLRVSFTQTASRRVLHAMIGNLVFVVPFFTSGLYAVAVAAPFVFFTFLATPYSPFEAASLRLKGLVAITEKGHRLGLVYYSIAYTILALAFASRPYVMAAGVLPMAYGDSFASVVGEKHGRRRYKVVADKSVEGSLAMFLASSLSLFGSWVFYSALYSLPFQRFVLPALAAIVAAVAAEGFSPLGLDNLTVPLLSALVFALLLGG
jgi:phytol kinase